MGMLTGLSDVIMTIKLGADDSETIVREYFCLGFQNKEIRSLLSCRHEIDICLSHLKRVRTASFEKK